MREWRGAQPAVNLLPCSGARGTWVESHYRWQIRTFWYALLWAAIGAFLLIALFGIFILIALTLWLVYRVAKGRLRLRDRRPMCA